MEKENEKMNRTITRSFEILEYVSNVDEKGVSLKDIIKETGMPKSSAFDIVHTLLALRYLEISKYNEKKYVLGLSAFTLGIKYSNSKSLISVCSPYVHQLADELNRTTFVGVLDGTDIVYIHKYTAKYAKLATCNIGTRHEAYCTSLGKALLAFLEPDKQSMILDQIKFVKKTSKTIDSKEVLIKELIETKQRGYSVDNKENEELMICYGAPIFDYTGKVIAAISFSDMRNPILTDEQIGIKIRNVALQISRELGYTGMFFKM